MTAAPTASDIVVVDSSDDEDNDPPKSLAFSKIVSIQEDVDLTNDEEAIDSELNISFEHDASRPQETGSAAPGTQDDDISSDQIPLTESRPLNTNEQVQENAIVSTTSSNHSGANETMTNLDDTEMLVYQDNIEAENQEQFEVEVPPERHQCDECPYVSRFGSCLKSHMRRHTAYKKPFKCPSCSERFAIYKDVGHHLKYAKHNKKFYCRGCDRGFVFLKQKNTHEEKCGKFRQFECPMCDFKTLSLARLEMHTRKHTGEKPYACEQCSKRFYYVVDLEKHQSAHAEQN